LTAVPVVLDGAVFLAPARLAVAFLVGAVMLCLLGSRCANSQFVASSGRCRLSARQPRHAIRNTHRRTP
jgi:hypothetical protein